MRRLSFRQVLEIVSGKPVEELILVGGQALNAWAEALGVASDNAEGLYGAALSDDIDFLGLAPAAIALAEALDADVAVATMDDHTPNAAIVTFDYDGEQNQIDVLHSLQGFSQQALEQVRRWAAVPIMPNAARGTLRVMHAVHCLQSQLENVYGALNRRDDEDGLRNANRVRLAVEVVRRTLLRYLDSGDADSARAVAEKVYELARQRSALRALSQDRVDITQAVTDDGRLGTDFVGKRLPQLRRYFEDGVDKDRKRQARKEKRS